MKPAAFLALFLAVSTPAQEPAFRADVSLIEVDAVVIGRTGVIDGLHMSDFAIEDNRRPVTLRYCVQEETPLDFLMMFETGRFMANKRDDLKVAAEMAMAEFREGDRFAVMSFDEAARVEWPFTGDLKEAKRRIRAGLDGAYFGSNPSILAAADASAKYLAAQPEPHQRRVVLMFTSDIGTGRKQENHLAVAKALWGDDAFLSAIVIPNRLTRFTHDDNPLHFRDVAALGYLMNFSPFDSIDDVVEQTGGEIVVYPGAPIRPKIQRMRKRYKLYYDRPAGKPGERRRIAIELSPAALAMYPDARIVARKGYVMQ